jgi:hypothetical protein
VKRKAKSNPRHARRMKRKVGRPIELTDALLARVAKHVEAGNYIETACDLEGVSVNTVRPMMREGVREARRRAKGETPDPHLDRAVKFAATLRRSRARAEKADLDAIRRAGKTQWQAHAWRLERRQPDRWAQRKRVEASGPGGGPITFLGTTVTPEQLKRLSDEELDALRGLVTRLAEPADDRAD